MHITSHRGEIPTDGHMTMPTVSMVISRFSTPTAPIETYDFEDAPFSEPPICTCTYMRIDLYVQSYLSCLIFLYLVDGWASPLKNMNVTWDEEIPNRWGKETTNQEKDYGNT